MSDQRGRYLEIANEMGRKITALLRSKKVVLFPEIGRVKNVFITHPPAQSNVCQYVFNLKKKKKKKKKATTTTATKKTRQKKAKESREEKNI